MKENSNGVNIEAPVSDEPGLRRLTRRQLLALLGGVAGVAAAAGGGLLLWDPESHLIRERVLRITLPAKPNHNPGFCARRTAEGGAVVWTYQGGKNFVGYRFNGNGLRIWRLGDGTRTAEEITKAYAIQTGRDQGEAAAFLAQLLKLGILASGGYVDVVVAGDSPSPPAGAYYPPGISPSGPRTT